MPEEVEKKEDNINSLCKKYFTPELCDESVTESKRTLELKLWTQLEMYGNKIAGNYSKLGQEDCEDAIILAIGECFKNWREKEPQVAYSVYYAAAVRRNFIHANEERQERVAKEVSLQENILNNPDRTVGDNVEDVHEQNKNEIDAALSCIVERLDKIEEFFCEEKNNSRESESTINCLSAFLTLEFAEDFSKWGSVIREEYGRNYSFMNKQVFGMRKVVNKKKLAELFGKPETAASRKFNGFLNKIKQSV